MSGNIFMRMAAALALFVAAFIFPWYLLLPLAALLILFFPSFYEAIVAGFVFDELHGIRTASFFHFYFVCSVAVSVFLVTAAYAKKHLTFYRRSV